MKRKLVSIIAVLIFLFGAGFFAYPYVMDLYAKYQSDKVMDDFKKDLARMKKAVEEEPDSSDIAAAKESANLRRLYEDMAAYNKRLFEEGQKDLKDPFSYEVPSFDLTEYGFKNNVIGIIDIEKMDVSMPLYLGASNENMKKGAVVLGETSMPTGENNTNMVVAAHRGYRGIKMFRDIQKLEIGDLITVTTPFETLTYRVCEIEIVLSDEIYKALIQPGRSLITLVTCHPYTKNTHRYLVFAEKIGTDAEGDRDENGGNDSSENGTGGSYNDGNSDEDNKANTAGQDDFDANGEKSERMIWLETYVPIIGGAIVVILIVVGMVAIRKKEKNNSD